MKSNGSVLIVPMLQHHWLSSAFRFTCSCCTPFQTIFWNVPKYTIIRIKFVFSKWYVAQARKHVQKNVHCKTHKCKGCSRSPIISHSSLSSGYGVLFRHPDDELNYCVYLIPGNPQVTNDKLPYWHERLIKDDGNLSRALGKKAKLERMKVGRFKCVL